jgi:hypothetical protein
LCEKKTTEKRKKERRFNQHNDKKKRKIQENSKTVKENLHTIQKKKNKFLSKD